MLNEQRTEFDSYQQWMSFRPKRKAKGSMKAAEVSEMLSVKQAKMRTTSVDESMPVTKDDMKSKMSNVQRTEFDSSLKQWMSFRPEKKAKGSMKAAEIQEMLWDKEDKIRTTSIDESMPVTKDDMKSKSKITELVEISEQRNEAISLHDSGWTKMTPGLSVHDEPFPESDSAFMSTLHDKVVSTSEITEIEVMPPEGNEAKTIHVSGLKKLAPVLSVQDGEEHEIMSIPVTESASAPGHTSEPSIETVVKPKIIPISRTEVLSAEEMKIESISSKSEEMMLFLGSKILDTNPSEAEGLQSIHETETENVASEAETGGQMKPELRKISSQSTLLVATSIKVRWPQFMNSELEIFHGGHSIKVHDLIKDPVYCNLLSEADDYQSARTSKKIEESPKLEPDHGNIFKGEGPSSRALERPERTSISLPEGFILERAGVGLKEPPTKKEWEQSSVIVLMDNEFSSLPEKPNCPNLGFLFLQRNRRLGTMPVSFFNDMPALRVLDLSKTTIRSLPTSLFKLTELQVLLLRNCYCLDELPPEVGNLQRIEVLDLWGTELYNLPDEIGKLSFLKLLQVSLFGGDDHGEYVNMPSNLISNDIVSNLLALQALSIVVHPGDWRWNKSAEAIIRNVCSLNELTYLQFYFPEVKFLKIFIETSLSWIEGRLKKFKFVVGQNIKRIASRVSHDIDSEYDQQDQCLKFVNGDQIPEELVRVLKNVTAFYLDHHHVICSLSEFGISNFQELEFCIVRECPDILVIIDNGERSESVLPFLTRLSIHYLWKLERIWKGLVPHGSLDRLKILSIYICPKLEFILAESMLHCLSNLEEFVVEDCASVKEIIKREGEMVKGDVAALPNLKKIELRFLPELVSFWNGGCPLLKQSNNYPIVYCCPKFDYSTFNYQDSVTKRRSKHRKLLGCV